ncbi:plasmid stabilization protein [Flavobacterium noncentrifugens]|uniref:Addiction module toxin, RelE/StbE family n=1 Tax=Flavobacterium noncentrifugens TaxID=1128970 RepID=A0A1G9DF36_9FLAO|nr:type II toxin-antitoxin system RelE/ParE family toxin [Flavobacterium noncentrifugens]GEP52819.1 plasmid stabilization protein [Flavobacterium noncentrifugens]SDK62457.1 addiction module toxin, RelE/StbE family [Flavobacterium noncentrifugens]
MSFEIIWSDQAENELDKIFEYYSEKVSQKLAVSILKEIVDEPNKLIKNPEISQIEDSLLDREEDYRYLVCNNYKLIYSIDAKAKQIKIADVFDTRQNPNKIRRTK